MMTDAQIVAKYGKPGDLKNIVTIKLPYPFRYQLSDTKFTEVSRMQCHKLASERFLAVFNDLLAHYGLEKIKELGIDYYGGCLNVRLQRGSKTKWSRHSWGIAVDLWPTQNQLKWNKTKARFARPEYKPMIDIFYKHGFIGYGPEKDYDWMHFELAN